MRFVLCSFFIGGRDARAHFPSRRQSRVGEVDGATRIWQTTVLQGIHNAPEDDRCCRPTFDLVRAVDRDVQQGVVEACAHGFGRIVERRWDTPNKGRMAIWV